MINFFRDKITSKEELLECLNIYYDYIIDEYNLNEILKEYIDSVNINDYDKLWDLGELKLAQLLLYRDEFYFPSNVAKTLLNNYLIEDKNLRKCHKEIFFYLLSLDEVLNLPVEPIFLAKIDIENDSIPLLFDSGYGFKNEYYDETKNKTLIYKKFEKTICDIINLYKNNISLDALKNYYQDFDVLLKYLTINDLLLNYLLSGFLYFYNEIYSIKIDCKKESIEDADAIREEIVYDYIDGFVDNFFIKLNPISNGQLVGEIADNFINLIQEIKKIS